MRSSPHCGKRSRTSTRDALLSLMSTLSRAKCQAPQPKPKPNRAMSAPPAISADVRTSAQQVGFVGVENIVKRFVTPEGTVCAVDDVSFDVRRGEFLSIIGPSGCGKSTLFNIIG